MLDAGVGAMGAGAPMGVRPVSEFRLRPGTVRMGTPFTTTAEHE